MKLIFMGVVGVALFGVGVLVGSEWKTAQFNRMIRAVYMDAQPILYQGDVGTSVSDTFRLRTFKGEPLDLHIGLVLLVFSEPWCKPCHEELPQLDRFARVHYQMRILVVFSGNYPGAEQMMAGWNHLVPVYGKDPAGKLLVGQYPTYILLKDGVIRLHAIGRLNFDRGEAIETIKKTYFH